MAVLTLVMLVVLIGFASLTLDVGALYNTRADLQDAADAAALAGGSALAGDAMLRVRQGNSSSSVSAEAGALILERAEAVGLLNYSFASSGTVIPPGDIVSGWIDLTSN
ncbi:MAG: pilus assembly protein TadG-related protein, partial [Phycisphaerales bacterium]|nr:pilus assembly protein TadG-related protein [Phycisphaerales bacterium]